MKRKAITRVLAAIGALLVAYGIVQPDQVETALEVVTTLLTALA